MTVFKKSFVVPFLPHTFSNHHPQQKMAAFYTYIFCAMYIHFDPSNVSSELNYFKYLAHSQDYNFSIIDKASNKYEKLKFCVCHSDTLVSILPFLLFVSSLYFRISKIFLQFHLKVSFKPVNKVKFSLPKDPIPTKNECGLYFIPCSCNLHCTGCRRWIKVRVVSIIVK